MDILDYVVAAIGGIGFLAMIIFGPRLKKDVDNVKKEVNDKLVEVAGGQDRFNAIEKLIITAVHSIHNASDADGMTEDEKIAAATELTKEFLDVAGHGHISDTVIHGIIKAEMYALKWWENRTPAEPAIKN